MALRVRFLQSCDEANECDAAVPAEFFQLEHVESPLAALTLAHVGLRLLQPAGEVYLGQPGVKAKLSEETAQPNAAGGDWGALSRILHGQRSLRALAEYPIIE